MSPETNPCQNCRDKLLDFLLESPMQAKFPDEITNHLEVCDACRDYQAGLRQMLPVAPNRHFYTPGLRYRTIARIEQRLEESPFHQERWLGLAMLVGLTFSYCLPLWILIRLVGRWIPSVPLTIGTAFLLFALLGVCTSAVAAALLFEKGNGLIHVKTIHIEEDHHV